ncbi:SDR family oxidoreductase [Rhizobium sp. AG855]|uniref:SDR family oxidoreductase n=1 Tax=Rhizobium sp. AG855 TaxID=2183898 RepID=UPI000E744DD5|nr:SDR family oxidoreductase [Rhizobium sp. AG855]RKE85553.1 UDP-N-acetylglucosamine 4-epimerase [Rhizobium sp. AG855]
MKSYETHLAELVENPSRWLVTGAAGFIGSHLVETLLRHDQEVVGLDNFSTGHRRNLDDVERLVGADRWKRFRLIEGDVSDLDVCREAVQGAHYVLHQAALGSVPRSIDNPVATNRANIDGFLNIVLAARDEQVRSFVYAGSSSTYGDEPNLPKLEDRIGRPLSPYAVTKYVNELYADVFGRLFGLRSTGLRYFNVFGPRQNPDGPYAAVIPRWINAVASGDTVFINGDGTTSRDFCFIANVVQANILAALRTAGDTHLVCNVAVGGRTTLTQLHDMIVKEVEAIEPNFSMQPPVYRDFRAGDTAHSLADITRAKTYLGYEPTDTIQTGLKKTVAWFLERHHELMGKSR